VWWMHTRTFAAVFALVCGLCHQATAQDNVAWSGESIVVVGELFDAPGGNVIGRLGDDQRRMKVDHWQGNWALVTGEGEPRIGWIERKSVRNTFQFMMMIPTRRRVPAPTLN
jgi:hypothetical protein